ncbi:MAG: DMT family transporter [Metallibacterium scheffleri]|jgi:drug/metabolite transporter (DMT)-like permease|uniref:DMT family transporter n=1 Tax=Metallibacterium scheffleri TaxID=993689 RepID=UPI0026EF4DE1|nr:DMT family transporter [Metallibacterium scheffleri]MCK9367727.1 DMT family transporter [Metallibacterium scheffleri]
MGLGEALSIGSALAWAVAVIIYKRLGETLPPLPLNLLKNLLVLGMLLLSVLALRTPLPHLDALGVGVTLLSGLLGMAAADSLYFAALNKLGAGRAGILGNLYSPFVIVLSVLFLGETMRPLQWLGFVLVSLGVLVVGHAQGQAAAVDRARARRGLIQGIAAIFLMAVAIVLIKPWLAGQPLLWMVLLRTLGGLLGLGLVFAWRRQSPLHCLRGRRLRWPLLLLAAFIGQYVAVLLWVGGYKYAPATVAAILNETSSAFIVLLAALLLREPLTPRKLIGVSCTLAGVACLLLA